MANILICDDHKYTRKMLEKIVSENNFMGNVFTAKDGIEAVKVAQQETVDIAILDIDMPNLNGIDAAKLINKISPKTRFIFITAHINYAVESFTVHPYDYIVKPIDIDRFNETLNTLVVSIGYKKELKEDTLIIKEKQVLHIIDIDDILYIEKEDRVVRIHTGKSSVTFNKTLAELEKMLNKSFIRTHKSFIVNKKKIERIIQLGNLSYEIRFKDNDKTALISRHRYDYLMESLPDR